MDQYQFWQIIATANQEEKDEEAFISSVTEQLEVLPLDDLIVFDQIFQTLHSLSYSEQLWKEVRKLVYCSDDGFRDFRSYLISQGEETFKTVLQNPKRVREVIDYHATYAPGFESLEAIGQGVWERKFDENKVYNQKFPLEGYEYDTSGN